MCFESAYGKFLCVEPDGKVVADRAWDNSWEQFRLERFSDPTETGAFGNSVSVPHHGGDGTGASNGDRKESSIPRGRGADEDVAMKPRALASESSSDGCDSVGTSALKGRDRFALRTCHGQYLR